MDYFESLKLIALDNVIHEKGDYGLRHVFRWYSREFHTPLHVVENLPLEDIMTHYFECQYEDMEDHHRQEEIRNLLQTEEEKQRIKYERDLDRYNDIEYAKNTAKKEAARIERNAEALKAAIEANSFEDAVNKKIEKPQGTATIESLGPKLPENIEMKFLSQDELDAMFDNDFANPKKDK